MRTPTHRGARQEEEDRREVPRAEVALLRTVDRPDRDLLDREAPGSELAEEIVGVSERRP